MKLLQIISFYCIFQFTFAANIPADITIITPINNYNTFENEKIDSIDLSSVFFNRTFETTKKQLQYCVYLKAIVSNECPTNAINENIKLTIEKSLLKISLIKDQPTTKDNPIHVFIMAKSSTGFTATDDFTMTINNINQPPKIIKAHEDITLTDATKYKVVFTEHFEDKDSANMTFNYKINDEGNHLFTRESKIDNNKDTLELFLSGKDGKAQITLTATDDSESQNDTTSDTFKLTVDNNKFSSAAECKPFCFDFVAGYEGTSVDSIKSKGNTRIEFLSHLWVKSPFNDVNSDENNQHEIHFSGNILQTSAASKTEKETDSDADNLEEKDLEIKKALEANFTMGYFWNSWALGSTNLLNDHRPGIITSIGGVKVDDGNFNNKYYIGIRSERSHLQYLDVLYGKTEGIKGHRAEFRGQLPISKKFLVGFILNIGVKDREANTDSIRIYISVPTSALGLFD